MAVVTKKDLVDEIRGYAGLTREQSNFVVDIMLTTIGRGLLDGHTVKLTGVGSLQMVEKPARRYIHPATGKAEMTKEGHRIRFRASSYIA